MMHPAIEKFANQIIVEAGLQNLKEDLKKQYILRLQEEMEKHIGVAVIKELPEKDLESLNTMFASPDELSPEKLMTFFSSKIPDFDRFLAETLLRFKDQFLKTLEKPKE